MELKILILDDEYIILDGLCSFPWEMYGCRIVGKAMDGEEGMELIDRYQPDIILSDIKMPEKDGIQVAKYAKEKYPDTEIILLTGYDSFSYAQQAITIGVADYLLKPVNFREMHEVIGKTCKKIRKNQFERQDYYELQKNYQKALPEIRAKLISDLLNGRLKDRDALEKKMNQVNLKIEKYLVIYGKLSGETQLDIDPGLLDFIICNICKEYLEKFSYRVYVETDPLGYTFLIAFDEEVNQKDAISKCKKYCEEMVKSIQEVMKCTMAIGISQVFRNSYDMALAYRQSVTACENNLGNEENGGIIEYQDVCQWENTAWEVTVGEKRTLFSAIHQGYVETAKEIVNRIFEGCQDIDMMRYVAMELLISCFQYVLNDEIAGIDENSRNLLPAKLESLFFCHNKKELLRIVNDTIAKLQEHNQDVKLDKKQQMATRIMEYICKNYSQDISLDELSEKFRISKTYINNLLKSVYHRSFLDILQDYRLKEAKKMILENQYKISEIAEKVGYHDISYFIRVFKKNMG